MSAGLTHVAQRAAREPELWASLLAVVEDREDLSAGDLARRLGVREDQIARLALCRRPRPVRELDDLDETARFIGAGVRELAEVYRLGQALEALGETRPGQLQQAARLRDDD